MTEGWITRTSISISELYPNYTSQFMQPFKNVKNRDISNGIHLDFEIYDRSHNNKICPILKMATSSDAKEITEIYKEIYNGTYPYKEIEDEHEVRKMIKSSNCHWILFKSNNGETLGCFTFVLDFKDKLGLIRGLMLRKKYQGIIDVVKAAVGSYLGMYSTFGDRIFRWYCENRTAHTKSQYALSIGGIRAIAFYPNKDIFNHKIESDIMHICYDERALREYRCPDQPKFIPEVKSCYSYSDKRYNLGHFKIISPKLNLNVENLTKIRSKIIRKISKDKFGYETITLTIEDSSSYFQFLYTPIIQNFEKTKYKVKSLEELFVFVQEFKKDIKNLNIRYCEIFVSAYNPYHQKILLDAGLSPRGYIPSWKYNHNKDYFEDFILFNYYEGEIDENIQLIPEGEELIRCLNFR